MQKKQKVPKYPKYSRNEKFSSNWIDRTDEWYIIRWCCSKKSQTYDKTHSQSMFFLWVLSYVCDFSKKKKSSPMSGTWSCITQMSDNSSVWNVICLIHTCAIMHSHVGVYDMTNRCHGKHMWINTPMSATWVSRRWVIIHLCATGWRRPVGCLKLRVIFHKRATNYRALLQKMTYKDRAFYASSPPCTWYFSFICVPYRIHMWDKTHKPTTRLKKKNQIKSFIREIRLTKICHTRRGWEGARLNVWYD